MPDLNNIYDIAIIGGGINGVGIARDAAGRGLSVFLAEANDLGGATSSASSKLIHGGLRYLEHKEFRLVREALAEREVLRASAPHIVTPMRFVLPHVPEMRPRLLIRMGLLIYDHLSRRPTIPGSAAVNLQSSASGAPLLDTYRHGFTYWDCWADDSRLVIINARAASNLGATICTRTLCLGAKRHKKHWRLKLRNEETGDTYEIRARALINAGGPWVDRVLTGIDTGSNTASDAKLRLVKGSHIVIPRFTDCHSNDAYILQNTDGRVIFVLPFESRFLLIGTTDVPYQGNPQDVCIDNAEISYLLNVVSRFFKLKPTLKDISWSFSGVRPLYNDNDNASASELTRDYRLQLDAEQNHPPLLTVIGGKLTTYRRLAEETLEKLTPNLGITRGPWTASKTLPGGDFPADDVIEYTEGLVHRYKKWDQKLISGLVKRHGTCAEDVIGDARKLEEMGKHIGNDLYEREVAYMSTNEWAKTPEDILWRRTKTGIHLSTSRRRIATETVAEII